MLFSKGELWYACVMDTPKQAPTTEQVETCASHPVGRALRLIGDVWTLIIVFTLLTGTKRFVELLQALGTASPETLPQRLKMLAAMGFAHPPPFLDLPPPHPPFLFCKP